jgi:hypothetical protein
MKSPEYWLKELYILMGEDPSEALELDEKNSPEQIKLFKELVRRIQNDASESIFWAKYK